GTKALRRIVGPGKWWVPYWICFVPIFAFASGDAPRPSKLIADAKPALEELWLKRFVGLEIYHIETAEWNLYRDEDDGKMNLWVSLSCDKAIKQFEDTSYTNMIPLWEINLVE